MMVKAVLMGSDPAKFDYVYGAERLEWLRKNTLLRSGIITAENINAKLPELSETEVIFSTWGMLPLTEKQLAAMPKLKAVFYAGGSVQTFAAPFLERNITVTSAVEANAIPVAEFCLSQIVLALKGYFANTLKAKRGLWGGSQAERTKHGAYGETVALLGIGAISRYLLRLLKNFELRVIAVSDHLQSCPDAVRELGIDRLVSLEEAFREAYVISNHLPDKADRHGILRKEYFAMMRPGATFINTGRGAPVDEKGLIEVFRSRKDLTALLDVTYPEPPEADSPLYSLDNIWLSSHIAGSVNDEVRRMADYMLDEFRRWLKNEPLHYAVDKKIFNKRA
ncbi:MAG: hydroxyacid dehydrogenase [Victivallales bacterium]|nr:hydroxyacid dehydrogenase [Victivallales bacterium]